MLKIVLLNLLMILKIVLNNENTVLPEAEFL